MKKDITQALICEHRLILRMIVLLEQKATLMRSEEPGSYQFYLDGVDFIRNYADRFHHAKEEAILFEALVHNGMPREHSPVAAMLIEHESGRAFVRAMEEATSAALAGRSGQNRLITENALAYVELLREHIAKEDEILYPLAERVIPEEKRDAIIASYAAAEARISAGFARRYAEIVARYEAEFQAHAA